MNLLTRKNIWHLGLAVVIVAAVLSIILLGAEVYRLFATSNVKRVDPEAYQAVFLTNDQIYFAHLRNIDSQYPILHDVYYVQIGKMGNEKNEIPAGRIVRLGETESHGPRNEMILNRDHILFWENLNFDSPVVQSIRNL